MHPEALTEAGSRVFPRLAPFRSFYLVGGTALALQIGHRVSVDFDLFSNAELPRTLLSRVRRVFPGQFILPTINNREQLNVSIRGVKTTFFRYQYPPILPLVTYQGVRMASVPEIAAMKAFAIGQRGTYRDYVDMYFLLAERHITIRKILQLAKKKYGAEFNDRLFLEQLVYLEDIPSAPVEFLRDSVDRKTIQQFLEGAVRQFARRLR